MGTLVCSRCKATTKADSIEEGRKRLDHGVGLHIGKPCGDGRAELFYTADSTTTNTTQKSKKTLKKNDKT